MFVNSRKLHSSLTQQPICPCVTHLCNRCECSRFLRRRKVRSSNSASEAVNRTENPRLHLELLVSEETIQPIVIALEPRPRGSSINRIDDRIGPVIGSLISRIDVDLLHDVTHTSVCCRENGRDFSQIHVAESHDVLGDAPELLLPGIGGENLRDTAEFGGC